VGGRLTFPLYSSYHATKWAVEGFSESLHYELAPLGIRVRIVEPGPIRTDFYGRSADTVSRPDLATYDDFVARTTPAMQEVGRTAPGPEVVAPVIYRAATDGGNQMRYTVNSALLLTLRRLLPDPIFFAFIRTAVVR
jgi:short-subunit dehydrogenase